MSSGERKRMMVKPCACDTRRGLRARCCLGRVLPVAAAAGRSALNRSGSRIPWDGGPQRVTAP